MTQSNPGHPSAARAASPSNDLTLLTNLVTDHQSHVTRTVRRLLNWRSDTDDVVQDIFLAALRQYPKFRHESSIKTWLTAIAIRRCRTERRKWWKRHNLPFSHGPLGRASDSTEASDLTQDIRSALRQLPHKDRELIILYYLEEHPVSEISKLLTLTESAINTRLHRARHRLAQILGPSMKDP